MSLSSFYSDEELKTLGLKSFGTNVLISRKVSIYGANRIEIGNNVRIDDYCILSASGNITLHDFIHIGTYTSLIGAGDIVIKNFCSISGKVSFYSSSDNYVGLGLTNPMIPSKFRRVDTGKILLNEHTIIGSGSVILPGTEFKEGCVIGALSLAVGDFEEYTIYSGNPIRKIGKRIIDRIKTFETQLKKEING